MLLTKSPIFAHDYAGPTPWSAAVLSFLRRFGPFSPATPISPPSGPATDSVNVLDGTSPRIDGFIKVRKYQRSIEQMLPCED